MNQDEIYTTELVQALEINNPANDSLRNISDILQNIVAFNLSLTRGFTENYQETIIPVLKVYAETIAPVMKELSERIGQIMLAINETLREFAENIERIISEYKDSYEAKAFSYLDSVSAEPIHESDMFVNNLSNAPPRFDQSYFRNRYKFYCAYTIICIIAIHYGYIQDTVSELVSKIGIISFIIGVYVDKDTLNNLMNKIYLWFQGRD